MVKKDCTVITMNLNLAPLKHSMLNIINHIEKYNNLMFFQNLFCPYTGSSHPTHQYFTITASVSFRKI